MRRQLGYEHQRLLLRNALLEENFVPLGEDDADEEFDHFPTEVGGRSVKEVLVDVGEHSGTRTEVMVGSFETLGVGPILTGGDGGMGGCDEEDDGSFLVGDRGLGYLFVREGVSPGEIDPDFRESEFYKFQLAEIPVEEIATWVVESQSDPIGQMWGDGTC